MMYVKVSIEAKEATDFLLHVQGELEDRRGLNESLGIRLAEEMQDYFIARNQEPNKRNWPKQNWWLGVADATQLSEVNERGATVTVAHREGFALRVRGGEIKPREAKSLTIPNVPEAYGKSVKEYEQATGHELFRPRGARFLAYDDGGDTLSLVYFLVPRVQIKADPHALPSQSDLADALLEEAKDFLERSSRNDN